MNIQSDSDDRGTERTTHLNGRAIDAELAGNMRKNGIGRLFQRGIGELLAGRQRSWQRWRARDREPGTQGRQSYEQSNEFVAVLSHELRNSLGAIANAAQILRLEESPGPAVVKARLLIERQLLQMSRVVEDLLDVSRIRSGQLRLQCARMDLSVAVAQSVSTVELAMQRRNHRVTVSIPEGPVWLQADSTRLEQVFVNLLVNAAKYTDTGGEIAVTVSQDEREAVVRIRDNGIGMVPELLPSVFDLFIQASPSSPRTEGGLGIGLALVRSLVESHGGHVTAQSDGLGQGSEFEVHLPLSADLC